MEPVTPAVAAKEDKYLTLGLEGLLQTVRCIPT